MSILPSGREQTAEVVAGLASGGVVTGCAQGEADQDFGDLLRVCLLASLEPDHDLPVRVGPISPVLVSADHERHLLQVV